MTRSIGRPVVVLVVAVTVLHASAIAALVTATPTPAGPAWLSLCIIPAMLLQIFLLAAVQGTRAFKMLNVLRALPVALYALAFLVIAATDTASLLVVTMAWVFSYIVAAAVTAAFTWRLSRAEAGGHAKPQSLTSMLKFGARGFFGSVSPTETFRVDQLLVGLVLSAQSLGLYVAALAFTNLPRFLAQGIGLVAYPAVAAASTLEEVRRLARRYVAIGAVIGFTLCGALAVLADPLISLAFGEAFAPAAGPLRVLLLATALLCPRRVLSDVLRGAGAAGVGSRAEALSWVVLVPGFFLLARPFGLYGVAFTIVAGYAASLGMLLVVAHRFLRHPAKPGGPDVNAGDRSFSPTAV